MLGDMADETDGKKSQIGSILGSPLTALLGHKKSKSSYSLEPEAYQTREKKDGGKMDEAKRDSGLPSEGSDCEVEVCASTSLEVRSRRPSSEDRLILNHSMRMEGAAHVSDSTKSPPPRTSVCIMSPQSHQGDGLLQVLTTTIGTHKGSPVYQVDFKGKLNDPSTFLVWYPFEFDETQTHITAFLHTLDPTKETEHEGSQSDIPREKFTYRLSWFKMDDKSVLAAQKAPKATIPFSKKDGALDLMYHPTKGGAITISLDDDKRIGTSADGDARIFQKPVWSDFGENPFTLLSMYDDGCSGKRGRLLQGLMNGENRG